MAIDGGEEAVMIREVLESLGRHSSSALGLDLSTAGGRARWLAAARLAAERDPEERTLAAFRALDSAIGASPAALREAGPERVATALRDAGLRRSEVVAAGLVRAARALAERHGDDLEELASGCLGLEELGTRLAALAPGLGAATVLRFLRPLRDVWGAAHETPLAATARAAAVHLGLIAEGEDVDGEPAVLQAALVRRAPDLPFADAEAALERLGARSCRAGRIARCPLGASCPARTAC